MGKTAELKVAQKTFIETVHKEGKPPKLIAEVAGFLQSALSKHMES